MSLPAQPVNWYTIISVPCLPTEYHPHCLLFLQDGSPVWSDDCEARAHDGAEPHARIADVALFFTSQDVGVVYKAMAIKHVHVTELRVTHGLLSPSGVRGLWALLKACTWIKVGNIVAGLHFPCAFCRHLAFSVCIVAKSLRPLATAHVSAPESGAHTLPSLSELLSNKNLSATASTLPNNRGSRLATCFVNLCFTLKLHLRVQAPTTTASSFPSSRQSLHLHNPFMFQALCVPYRCLMCPITLPLGRRPQTN